MGYQNTFERVEMKYLLTRQQKQQLLWAMEPYLQADEYGKTTILNIYYDTPDYQLIRHSLEKPIYKEKLRLRSYGTPTDDSTVFIELKKKYKGIVYKRRVSAKEWEAILYLSQDRPLRKSNQITKEIDYFKKFYQDLNPTMAISYEREAFCSQDSQDLRITFDEELLWREEDFSLRSGAYGKAILEKGMVLMEIKTAYAMPLWLTSKLSELGIFQTGFSKYGSAYLDKTGQRGAGKAAVAAGSGRINLQRYFTEQEKIAQ